MHSRELPPAARAIASAVTDAVEAASAADGEGLRAAAAVLAGLDGEQTGIVLGALIRMRVEELHPDGLDGDDVRAVLERSARRAVPWLEDVDPHALLIVLAGALGIHPEEYEDVPRPTGDQIATHAPLLVADLLQGRPVGPYLGSAFAEIARSEIMDAL